MSNDAKNQDGSDLNFENGEPVQLYSDRSGEMLIQECATRFGISAEAATEILAFYDAELSEKKTTGDDFSRGFLAAVEILKRASRLIMGYGETKAFCFQCFLLAMGWKDELGCDSQVELAERWNVKRAAVNKCVVMLQRRIGPGLKRMQPGDGQRKESAAKSFRDARKSQLKKPEPKS